MPWTNAGLSAAIKTEILATQSQPPSEAELDVFCSAIGKAIVTYLKVNGLVIIPVAAINTTGGPAAQSGPPAPVNLTIT